VYVSNRSGTDDLYLTEASGANQVRLTTSDDEDRFPAWSADGAHIIFSRENVNGAELVSFQTDCMAEPGACESFLQTITFNRYDLYPEWLPGDTGLVFSTSDYPGLPSAIGLFDIATSTAIALDGTGSTDFDPALSPDGGWIAFVSNARSSHDIWAMRLDGTGLTRVILNVSTDIQPAWSHRGDFLVFASDRGSEGGFDLYLIAAACILGNYVGCEDNLIRITSDTADDLDPDWTP
nr:PD40 domain-containing protein [Anaerolineae bacterium]